MNERETAAEVLISILDKKAYNNIALKTTLDASNLNSLQRAFVTELVNGTLRNLILLDYVISCFSKTPIKKLRPLILNILRISVYQILFLDKTPESAVCNEAVKIVKKRGFKQLSGFVNAVLRNIVRNKDNISYPAENTSEYLSIRYSYPIQLIEYWLKELNYEQIEQLCISSAEPPDISACVNTIKTEPQALKTMLESENIAVFDSAILELSALRLSKTGDLSKSQAYNDGLFHVMDESAMLAVKALNPMPNERILDVCAAPGGKSFLCAYMMKNSGAIHARDIYKHKLELINSGAQRLGISIITTDIHDAAVVSDIEAVYDKVIIDAPCSGLGLTRKKPDIKYNKKAEDIAALAQLQRDILKASSAYVKTGGTLVYCTCTISSKENLDNVEWFCNNFNYKLDSLVPYIKAEIPGRERGYIQILPQMFGTDGFFIARMIKI